MTRTLARTTILMLLAGACAPPPPVAPRPEIPKLPASAPTSTHATPSPEAAIVSVTVVGVPPKLAIDGDVAEWGSLLPPPPKAVTPAARQDPEDPPSGPNPRDAPSHLAFALTNDAALIAADLGEPARDGIWLGIGSRAADLPQLGQQAGRAGFLPLQCEMEVECHDAGESGEGSVCQPSDKPNPPEVVAACRKLLARRADFEVTHEKRFVALFKIDRDGVRRVSAAGELSAVRGAKSVWKPAPKGATVEISLPLEAMPRVAEAPLETMRLVARAVASPEPPELAVDQWVWLPLPAAVSFEPYGALRTRAFAPVRERALRGWSATDVSSTTFVQPFGLSYQPGDALHVEITDGPGESTSVTATEHALYQKQANLGDVEVGYGYGQLSIFKNGKLAGMLAQSWSPRGVIARDGELHVFGFLGSSWVVLAVGADGSHRDAMEPDTTHQDGSDSEVTEFADETFDSFGWRGVRKRRGVEVTFRWDGAHKKYTAKRRTIPVPKKAKKAGK